MVAVKIVTHDRTLATLAETLRESALSTSIQHPNVVRILSACMVQVVQVVPTLAVAAAALFIKAPPCQVCSEA
jgi:hypothetical protein